MTYKEFLWEQNVKGILKTVVKNPKQVKKIKKKLGIK